MVRFVNLFEVPSGEDERFLAVWRSVNDYMRDKPGYLGHRLHRSLTGDARYRYVNYVAWESAEAWRNGHDEGFRALAAGMRELGVTSAPALYEVLDEAGVLAGDGDGPIAAASSRP